MSWTDWILRRKDTNEDRPSVRDVTFDAMPLRVHRKATDLIEWVDEDQDRVSARIHRATPETPLAPWTLPDVRASVRADAGARKGGLVSLTWSRATNAPIARAVCKFDAGLGHEYEGTVLIRFQEALYSLTLTASERGTTGTRDAMTSALLMQLGEMSLPLPGSASGTAIPDWAKDPYDDAFDEGAVHTKSDDERLDPIFPQHSLSKVRRWLTGMEQTLAVSDDLLAEIVNTGTESSAPDEDRHRMPPFALGILFLQMGRPDVAEPLLLESVHPRGNEPDPEVPRLADKLILLGVAREMLGRLDEAIWAGEWAVRTMEATAAESDPTLIRARANLARTYAASGRTDDAEPLLNEVIPAFEAQGNDSELAVALNARGLVRQRQNRHTEAMTSFERAHAVFEKLKGPDFIECGTVLRNMSRSAAALGDDVGSKRYLNRAEQIFAKNGKGPRS